MSMDLNSPIYFLHIPKTAGTTVTSLIDSQFPQHNIFPVQKWPDFISLPKLEPRAKHHKLFRGHFGFGFHRYIGEIPKFVTMLRNPVDQVVSHYFHQMVSVSKGRPRASKLFSGDESILDIFSDPVQKIMFSNFQVKYLALDIDLPLLHHLVCRAVGTQSKFEQILGPKPEYVASSIVPTLNLNVFDLATILEDNGTLEDFIQFPNIDLLVPALSGEELLSLAKKNLSKFHYFGIVENMPESVDLLCSTFNWKTPDAIPYMNSNANRDNEVLNDNVISVISSHCELDQELYEFAKSMFQKRCCR